MSDARIKLVIEVSDFNEHLALEAGINIQETPNILYPNHFDGGYISLPINTVALIVDGKEIELPKPTPKEAEETDGTTV
jgi:hypothetical protein